jgi:hypothetical protein
MPMVRGEGQRLRKIALLAEYAIYLRLAGWGGQPKIAGVVIYHPAAE